MPEIPFEIQFPTVSSFFEQSEDAWDDYEDPEEDLFRRPSMCVYGDDGICGYCGGRQ